MSLYFNSWKDSSNKQHMLIINADTKDNAEAKLRAWCMFNKNDTPKSHTLRPLVVKDCLLLTSRD